MVQVMLGGYPCRYRHEQILHKHQVGCAVVALYMRYIQYMCVDKSAIHAVHKYSRFHASSHTEKILMTDEGGA